MSIEAKAKLLVTAAIHEALAKTFGPKILERLKGDSSYGMLKDEIAKHPGNDLAEKVVHHIISKAPHDKYKRWMAQSYANGGINKLDDVDKTAANLAVFHKHSAKMANEDIGAYKGFHELDKAVEPYKEAKTRSEEGGKGKTDELIKNGHATLVHEGPKERVIIPQTEEASKHFGKNTRWCTAATDSRNYFNDYHKKGNLMYFLDKKANKRHAIFFPHKQFENGEYQQPEGFDEVDKPVAPRKILEMHPESKKSVLNALKDKKTGEPQYAHMANLGKYDHVDEKHPDWNDPNSEFNKSADEIDKLVAKHIK